MVNDIKVTDSTDANANNLTVVVDGQRKLVAVSKNGSTLLELMEAVTQRVDSTAQIVLDDGDEVKSLDGSILIHRGGVTLSPTTDPNTKVYPDDLVVRDRKHNNG